MHRGANTTRREPLIPKMKHLASPSEGGTLCTSGHIRRSSATNTGSTGEHKRSTGQAPGPGRGEVPPSERRGHAHGQRRSTPPHVDDSQVMAGVLNAHPQSPPAMAGITTSLLHYPMSAGVVGVLRRPWAGSANHPNLAAPSQAGSHGRTDAIATAVTEQLPTGAGKEEGALREAPEPGICSRRSLCAASPLRPSPTRRFQQGR